MVNRQEMIYLLIKERLLSRYVFFFLFMSLNILNFARPLF